MSLPAPLSWRWGCPEPRTLTGTLTIWHSHNLHGTGLDHHLSLTFSLEESFYKTERAIVSPTCEGHREQGMLPQELTPEVRSKQWFLVIARQGWMGQGWVSRDFQQRQQPEQQASGGLSRGSTFWFSWLCLCTCVASGVSLVSLPSNYLAVDFPGFSRSARISFQLVIRAAMSSTLAPCWMLFCLLCDLYHPSWSGHHGSQDRGKELLHQVTYQNGAQFLVSDAVSVWNFWPSCGNFLRNSRTKYAEPSSSTKACFKYFQGSCRVSWLLVLNICATSRVRPHIAHLWLATRVSECWLPSVYHIL